MQDFLPQFTEFFSQMFWGALQMGMIFLTVRIIAFFLMPWKWYSK